MSVSVRTRFEIFKRDRFTCRYCGRHTPDVVLEVDHVIPVAAGGTDDFENLVTACWDCNRGKAARLVHESSASPVTSDEIRATQERVEQARAYAEAVAELRAADEAFVWRVTEAWAQAFRARIAESPEGVRYTLEWSSERFPSEASIRRILRRLPLNEVLEAVDITASRFDHAWDSAERYFFGICWRKVSEREGRAE